MTKFKGQERRKFVRFPFKHPFTIKYKVAKIEPPHDKKTHATVRNVSGGGMFLEIDDMPDEIIQKLLTGKYDVILDVIMPDDPNPILAHARIVWIDRTYKHKTGKHGVGVSFTQICEEDRERLMTYMIEKFLQDEKE